MAGWGGRQVKKPADWDYASERDLATTCRWNPLSRTSVCRLEPTTLRLDPCEHVTSSPAFVSRDADTDGPEPTTPRKTRSPFVKAEG